MECVLTGLLFSCLKIFLSLMTILDCMNLVEFLSLIIVSVQESFIGNF